MSQANFKSDEACAYWWQQVASAAAMYERRWTRSALRRVDPALADRLAAQQSLFDHACLHGTVSEIEEHGAGMVRGWIFVVKAMEAADVADDAYMLGSEPRSGLKVAVGIQKAAAERVVEVHGQDVVWITPDEVAALLATDHYKSIAGVKQQWPGAEIVGAVTKRYESEGT